jgi:hypothetical protein
MDNNNPPLSDTGPREGNGAAQGELTDGDLEHVAGGADPCPPIFYTKAPPDPLAYSGSQSSTSANVTIAGAGGSASSNGSGADASGSVTGTASNTILPKFRPAQ